MIEIIDNLLSEDDFFKIKEYFIGNFSKLPWFYSDSVVYDHDSEIGKKEIEDIFNFQFVHTFYDKHVPSSNHISIIEPIYDKIVDKYKFVAFMRIKANLLTNNRKEKIFPFHVDFNGFKGKTAIFYINTNNGKTIFENGEKIDSIENRLVIFDSKLEHTGTTCSDQSTRCLINFNFFAND
jgi:hypothetical protein